MSERMTDERLDALTTTGNLGQVARECRRARASESAKDAQIKALADGLWSARGSGSDAATACWCTLPSDASFCRRGERNPGCVAKIAALRLVGRLP